MVVLTNECKNISEKCRDGKYKHREKRGGLYIICRSHHKFSTRPKRRGCKVGGHVLNLWCDLHIYKAHLFSPDACTCHPYIFPKCFFTCSCRFIFIDTKCQNGLNHRRRTTLPVLYILICRSQTFSRLKRRVYYLGILACSCTVYSVEAQSEVTDK